MPSPPAITGRLEAELRRLSEGGQLRALRVPQGIDFNSNDYLGLSTDPRLRAAVEAGLAAGERAGSGGSRLLSGHARVWDELEEQFAAFVGAESALFFTSGYAANVGLLSAVIHKDDVVFSDSANHASMIDGIRLSGARKVILPHGDLAALEDALRKFDGALPARFIVVESLFSMEGDRSPLVKLTELAERFGASLIVDEAHAVGVYGPEGRGLVAEAGAVRQVFAGVYPCGKALASAGAFVCGSPSLKQYLINRARTFIFNTALPPYFAWQLRAAMEAVRGADTLRERVHLTSDELRRQLRAAGLNTGASDSHIVPVILGANERANRCAEALAAAGFTARAIRPPTVPAGTARLRLSVTAHLDPAHLPAVVATIVKACRGQEFAQAARGGE